MATLTEYSFRSDELNTNRDEYAEKAGHALVNEVLSLHEAIGARATFLSVDFWPTEHLPGYLLSSNPFLESMHYGDGVKFQFRTPSSGAVCNDEISLRVYGSDCEYDVELLQRNLYTFGTSDISTRRVTPVAVLRTLLGSLKCLREDGDSQWFTTSWRVDGIPTPHSEFKSVKNKRSVLK